MAGHYTPNKKWTNECWGLEPFPSGNYFLSAADDGTLRKWCAKERKLLAYVRTDLSNEGEKVPPD